MKRKNIKRIVAGFWALAVVGMSSMTALAADTVDVSGSGKYAGETDIVVGYQDKDLFSDMKNLMPGDTVENQVALSNKSTQAVTIYLKAYPGFTSADGETAVRDGSQASAAGKTFRDDILNQIEMTLKLDDKVIYEGSADGASPKSGYEAMTAGDYGLNLGSFAAGNQKNMVITLHLPGPVFDNGFVDTFDAVDWVFCVEGTTPSGGGGNPPGGGGGGGHDRDRSPNPGPGTVTEIVDSEVPLAPWTGEDGDSNIVILDSSVPLASIPKMGDTGTGGYLFGILLALLIACSALYMRKRYSVHKQ